MSLVEATIDHPVIQEVKEIFGYTLPKMPVTIEGENQEGKVVISEIAAIEHKRRPYLLGKDTNGNILLAYGRIDKKDIAKRDEFLTLGMTLTCSDSNEQNVGSWIPLSHLVDERQIRLFFELY